jgi:hypothetical protein
MNEYEYYTSSPYALFCKAEGYFDLEEKNTKILRHATYLIHRSLVAKPVNDVRKFWPIGIKENEALKPKPMTKELFEKILKNHNITWQN